MTVNDMTVFIVDDDEAVRDSLADLMDLINLRVETYASALDFLASYMAPSPGCLVLDIRMPGLSGLDLQAELVKRNVMLPIVFITGHGDIQMAVQAMRAGAQDFIQKPFREQELLDSINLAMETGNRDRKALQVGQSVKQNIQRLTAREREVMDMIIEGKANKVIAIDMGLSQRTVEVHRANVMHKLKVRSLADLVRTITRIENI